MHVALEIMDWQSFKLKEWLVRRTETDVRSKKKRTECDCNDQVKCCGSASVITGTIPLHIHLPQAKSTRRIDELDTQYYNN